MPDETPAAPVTLEAVAARLQALEVAVASVGAPSITHTHDGFAKFREWLSAFLARV